MKRRKDHKLLDSIHRKSISAPQAAEDINIIYVLDEEMFRANIWSRTCLHYSSKGEFVSELESVHMIDDLPISAERLNS